MISYLEGHLTCDDCQTARFPTAPLRKYRCRLALMLSDAERDGWRIDVMLSPSPFITMGGGTLATCPACVAKPTMTVRAAAEAYSAAMGAYERSGALAFAKAPTSAAHRARWQAYTEATTAVEASWRRFESIRSTAS